MTTLKAALQEAYFMELEEIPSEEILSEDEALTFSPAFERKMKKLIRRADHPIRYRIAQAAACLMLAALLSGCTILAVSPEARAAFVGWVRETYEDYFVYYFTGDAHSNSENYVFEPSWIPDGYTKSFVSELSGQTIIVFEDENKTQLTFGYSKNLGYWKLYVDIEDSEVQQVEVSGQTAEMYSSNSNGGTKHLIWIDKNTDCAFFISANLSKDTMIKIAESVEAQEVPKPQVVYRLTWVPEGYSELKESISDDQVVIVYRNDEGYLLAFTYTKNRESVSAYVLLDNQETDVQAVLVGGKTADLYLEQQADKASVLVWGDDEKGVFFAISAHCSGEELIKIAESVEAVQ